MTILGLFPTLKTITLRRLLHLRRAEDFRGIVITGQPEDCDHCKHQQAAEIP